MFKNRFLILACLVITSCAPSPVQLTSTANAALAQTATAAPTATYTPSLTATSTLTPTSTPTETPIPTPLGGGIGKLVFALNSFAKEDSKREQDGIYTINSDGTGLEQILSRSQVESIIGTEYDQISYDSFAGENYIVADGDLYVLTENWQLIRKLDLHIEWIYEFSPEGRYVVYEGSGGYKFVASIDGLGNKLLFGPTDYFTGISGDGKTIYYEKDRGLSTWAVNSDGSNKRKLELIALKNFTPYENAPLPDGALSVKYYPLIDRMATSPDKKKIAFTWNDLLFIADAADTEFQNPQLIARLPEPEHAYTILWSPDGNYLLIGIYFCKNNTCNFGDIVLFDIEQNQFEMVYKRTQQNLNWLNLCGFSPDGNQIVFLANRERFKNRSFLRSIGLAKRGVSSPINFLVEDVHPIRCPVWR